jgi:uncharacterized membrane protein YdjX (TVP38/TMEM64 family)
MHAIWIQHVLHWMQVIQSAGWMGWLMFIGLYAACCVFFIPASVLTIAAGAVYGMWGGSALVLTGNALGSLVCLLLTRYFFRDWAKHQISRHEKLKAVEEAVQEDGWKMVFLTRLSPLMPFSLINYALGLTKLSAWRFLLATEVGSVPATIVYVYLGTLMGNLAKVRTDLHGHQTIRWEFQGAGLVITIAITIYITHLASQALKKRMNKGRKQRAK